MSRHIYSLFVCLVFCFGALIAPCFAQMKTITLPEPRFTSTHPLHATLIERRSVRSFDTQQPLTLEEVSVLLWATYGKKPPHIDAVTSASYTTPSAGGIIGIEVYVVVGDGTVQDLAQGVYLYDKQNHTLNIQKDQDVRSALTRACLGQSFITDAPISIVLVANPAQMQRRYGARTKRYVILEAGHAAQNIYLMCSELGLATVEVGAFRDNEVSVALGIDLEPLLIFPIGHKKK